MSSEQWSDFTTKAYRQILNVACKRYTFVRFDEEKPSENALLWRHDVDFSVHRALQLARIEAEFGVHTTYFVQLTCIFYNLFEQEIREKLREIRSLGHAVELHFAPLAYDAKHQDIVDALRFEKDVLGGLLGSEIHAVSLHNPDAVNCDFSFISEVGLINAYDFCQQNGWRYCSDSNGYWRYDSLQTVLEQTSQRNLHVLTHPAWWQDESLPPRARIERCAYERYERTMERYDCNLRRASRKNID